MKVSVVIYNTIMQTTGYCPIVNNNAAVLLMLATFVKVRSNYFCGELIEIMVVSYSRYYDVISSGNQLIVLTRKIIVMLSLKIRLF